MAEIKNSIGDEEFLSLLGVVDPVKTQLEILARPGVDGIGLWDTGRRAAPIQLLSQVDLAAFNSWPAKFADYVALIDADPVKLVISDQDFETLWGLKFQVLNVQLAEPVHRCPAFVGGLNAPSLAFLQCIWTLIAIGEKTEGAD